MLSTKIHSFTHDSDYDAVISRDYLKEGDSVLLVDDFLASGNALDGLIDLCEFAGAKVRLSGSTTPKGSVSEPVFTGTQETITVS